MTMINSLDDAVANRALLFCTRTELNKHPVEGFSAGLVDDSNFYEWDILIMGPPDTY